MMLTEHQLKLYQLPIEASSQNDIPASRELIIEKYPTDSAAKKAYNKAMKQMNIIEIRGKKPTSPKIVRAPIPQSAKIGYWEYWFKAPDGFDIVFSKNKTGIPKGYKYVQHLRVHKPDGNIDCEIVENGKVIWARKNTNKLSECQKLQHGLNVQEQIHKALNVSFPRKEYKHIIEKRKEGCKLK